jgi:hypothetical protein
LKSSGPISITSSDLLWIFLTTGTVLPVIPNGGFTSSQWGAQSHLRPDKKPFSDAS